MPNPDNPKPLALIAGPTASGKTALALHLARRHNVTIINADSAQVYDALPILSAQPTAAEMAQAPHKLFGYLDGRETCSAARWASDAKIAIAEAWQQGRLPVLVGGTGLYIRTLLDGIAPIPEISPAIRSAVRERPTADAYAELFVTDPAIAATLNPNDDSRIKRALEVICATGRSLLEWRKAKTGGISGEVDLHPLILLPPRDWLHQRCETRFEAMMDTGAIEEVRQLLALGLPSDAPAMRAIGVPEIAAMLAGEIDRQQAIAMGQAATRQYAKRQYTWFRNQSDPDWPRWTEELSDVNFDQFERLLQL